ncbi:MAG: hypothetical protein ACM30I_10730 [Gemmatimonas sp.]
MTSIMSARVERFRRMADEIRTAAVAMTYRESQRALTSIADNYELLADQLEQVVARERVRDGAHLDAG